MSMCLVERIAPPTQPALPAPQPEDGSYLAHEFAVARKSRAVQQIVDSGAMYDGLWYWDLKDQSQLFVSPMFWDSLGYPTSQPRHTRDTWLERTFEEDRESILLNLKAHIEDASIPFDQTLRMRRADGNAVTVRSRGVAIREDGVAVRMIGSLVILSDTRVNELSDRLSEIFALSKDAIVVWSHSCGVKRWNRGAERMFGLVKPAILNRHHFDRLTPQFPEDWSAIEQRVRSGQTWVGQVEWTREDGRKVITETQFHPVQVSCGLSVFLEIDRDITQELALAQQHRTVMRELNHRIKNLFSVIRALVKLTAKGQNDVPPLVRDLDKRISALAAAHVTSLGHETKDGAPVDELFRAVLSAYPADPGSLIVEGPRTWLGQAYITPMGLILNELATNALKYGAWSVPDGTVAISWSVTESDGDLLLTVRWNERTPGFVETEASIPGFGSQLIDLSVRQLGATLSRRFGPDGLKLSLTLEIDPEHVEDVPALAA